MIMIEQAKRFQSVLAVIVSILGSWAYLNTYVSERIVSKAEFQMATNEIRLGQVEAELRYYQRIGIDKLSEQDRHEYDTLVNDEQSLRCARMRMAGFNDNC